jgi:hypothetical protein
VRVYTFANREGHGTNLVKKDRLGALVDIVEVGPAHPPTALVTSEQMASEINRTGRIALYGLYFDNAFNQKAVANAPAKRKESHRSRPIPWDK